MEQTLKKPNRRPTVRQKRAAKAIVENRMIDNPKPDGEVLASVGYGKIIQDPKRILESTGFKKALAEYGLTEELITTSLVADIKAKPQERVKELGLGADILGMRKREEEPYKPQGNNVYNNFFFSKDIQDEVKSLEEKIKNALIKKHV